MTQISAAETPHHPLDRQIARLAFPAIVSNITVPLLGLCDTAISGHLGDTAALGAISVGSMMLNVAYWLFGFLRMGTTGLAAEACGARDTAAQRLTLWRSLAVAAGIGLLLIFLSRPLCILLLQVTGATPDVANLAGRYYRICICGAPALLATMAFSGWMVGMQSTVLPMIVAVSVNIINIILSLTFVFGCGMGFTGVAYGTLISQWAGLLLAVVLSARLGISLRGLSGSGRIMARLFNGRELRRFLTVNTDLFFRSACIMGVSLTITSVGARLGTVTLAANAVMMQFFIFFSYFMDGFAFAAEALTGRYKGARDRGMLRSSVKRLLVWSGAMALLFFAVYLLWQTCITSLITDDAAVIARVGDYRLAVVLIPPLSVGAFICDGFYIGMTATRRLLLATLGATAVFFAVAFLPSWGGIPGNGMLWAAFLTYLALRALFLGVMVPKITEI